MKRIAMLAGVLGLLLSMNAWAVLKTYDVEPQYREEVYAALRGILTDNPGPTGLSMYGRVERLPTGQLLVDAAPETLAQIDGVLAAIRSHDVDDPPRATLRYWVVLGEPPGGEGENTAPILTDVLREIERVHGDLTFRVLGNAALATRSGEFGHARGLPLSVEQRVYVQGQTLNGLLRINFIHSPESGGEVEINVTLEPREFLVLAENSVRTGDLDGMLFYIVQWSR